MQTADSNENLRLVALGVAAAGTQQQHQQQLQQQQSLSVGGSDEQNENHEQHGKYHQQHNQQPLSWRSNGLLLRTKENHDGGSSSAGGTFAAEGNALSWRSGGHNNREDYYAVAETGYEQDKKFNTRTFEKSAHADLDTEKIVLRSSNHNNPRNSRTQQQQQQQSQQSNNSGDKSRNTTATLSTHLLLSEDLRISKILRRLLGENSASSALDLCKKLEIAVRTPENIAYICRSFEYLTESLLTVLKQCPVQCAEQASNILGLVGYINRADFPIYKNYITKTYQSCKGIQKYLMMALRTTFSCDAINLSLLLYSDRVLTLLKDYLENADKADVFIAISDTIAEFAKHYKRAFEKHFTDIVDIIVGWHLELEQPATLKQHCATVLQQLTPYFVQELDFTFGLLGQFLEDISAYADKGERNIGAFIGAYNSILKSVATQHEFIAFSVGSANVAQALHTITRATQQCLREPDDVFFSETILNANEFFYLIFANNSMAVEEELPLTDIVQLLALQLKHFTHYDLQQAASLLCLVRCILQQLRAQTPTELVTMLLQPSASNTLSALKYAPHNKLYKLLLKIYHEILGIKNVPLLQEAYRHIVADVNCCMAALADKQQTNASSYSRLQAECVLNFYLAALSALATQTSSIIGMYALSPSILELLIVNCRAANVTLWAAHATLHSALLQLLAVHCNNNHNFRMSALILKETTTSKEDASPTSLNFSLILTFLDEILAQNARFCAHNLEILLHWTLTLLAECQQHALLLCAKPNFRRITQSLCVASLQAPGASARCLTELLLHYPALPRSTLHCMRLAALCMFDSVKTQHSAVYMELFARLPLSISLDFAQQGDVHDADEAYEALSTLNNSLLRTTQLQQWHVTAAVNASPLREKYFKPYLAALALTATDTSADTAAVTQNALKLAPRIYAHCWQTQQHQREQCHAYQQLAVDSSQLLSGWLPLEAARYCVRQKLRTSVGKPQATFLKIEAIIMQYARNLALKEQLPRHVASLENIAALQCNVQQLLRFLDALEQQIYNAAVGTAFACAAVERPAQTFFRVNAPTCAEWFKRIRTAVDLIALHSMQPALVVRYGELMLRQQLLEAAPSATDKNNALLLEHTIMSLVWALLELGETDSLQGLYSWLRARTDRRYSWIKYAAEQSAGHKELAADGYEQLLNATDVKLDAYISEFLHDQLLECLQQTQQWQRVRQVLQRTAGTKRETLRVAAAHNKRQLNVWQKLAEADSLSTDEDDEGSTSVMQALQQLTLWPQQDSAGKEEVINFSYYQMLHRAERACMTQLLNVANDEHEEASSQPLPAGLKQALHSGLQQCYAQCSANNNNNNKHLNDFVLLNHVAQKLQDGGKFDVTTFDCSAVVTDSTLLLNCLQWSRLFEQQQHQHHLNQQHQIGNINAMHLHVAAAARREGNAKLCSAQLERFFTLKGLRQPLAEIAAELQSDELQLDITDTDLLSGFTELTQYLYANNSSSGCAQLEAINVGAAFCAQIIEQVEMGIVEEYPPSSAKMLLTLAEWLLQRGGVVGGSGAAGSSNGINSPQLQSLLANIEQTAEHSPIEHTNDIIPAADMAIGKLIQASIQQNRSAGQAWCAFGNWCYRWGKKLVETKTDGNSTQKAGLSARDLAQIREFFDCGENGEDIVKSIIDDIVAVLQQHSVNANDGEEDIESHEISTTELIESQLRRIKPLADIPAETIASIIKMWRQAHNSIYTYYEMAAGAYFKYLCIETQGKGKCSANAAEDSSLVTTTLRLLRLVVKHAFGLQEVLEEGLSNTPTRPWKVIIPQLFSRLAHHEPYVRKRVSELLCRVAEDKPHLIIFPAVVGAQQELKRSTESSDKEHEPTPEMEEKTPLSTCFNTLLATLLVQTPDTVQQVQLLVRELKRVTLLWDEYWMHALAQLYSEYASLFSTFEAEAKKSNELQFVALNAKHAILMRHVIADLQRISAVTEKPPETNYERNFQERYTAYIQNTIAELEQPLNMTKPNDSWLKLKQLYNVFQQRGLRNTASSTLKMYDISPILATMRNTNICMPGVETNDKQPVYIRAVDSTVYILPTKTKPKKLAFFGSDGRKYTYLFKGFEDLHLDERIMQFLSISNAMMARSNSDAVSASNCYRAHHYSVIPLGPQSGLISWVDGVTPLFSIYKKWQQREALVKQQQKERPNQATALTTAQQPNSVPAAIRPSDLFYGKLTPLLAEQNIKITDTRKHWPLATLRRVLTELTQETPRDLLAKELWCHATNASEWRRSVRNYSHSVAVMSVIGYVIGLGDRHLDNVLVKLSSGEIVHIDYNVCFEKGKTLRVPEKVPFRMTPNLEEALGITGIEGTFRLGCEHVLRTLRKERETLLTLLEAFVYDPLVDWAVSDDGGTTSTRRTTALVAAGDIAALKLITVVACGGEQPSGSLERRVRGNDELLMPMLRRNDMELNKQTIGMRFKELKSIWLQYNDEVTAKLQQIVAHMHALDLNRQDIQHAEQERDSLTKQLAMIRELQSLGSAIGSHPLNTITQRYGHYKQAAEQFNAIKKIVRQMHSELTKSADLYLGTLLTLPHADALTPLLRQLHDEQQQSAAAVYGNEFELVRELLEQSAQEPLYAKADFARKEMDITLTQQARKCNECLELLQRYAHIMRYYSHKRVQRFRLLQYQRWYGELLEEESDANELLEQLQCQVTEDRLELSNMEQMKKDEYMLIWMEDRYNVSFKNYGNEPKQEQQQNSLTVEMAIKAIELYISESNNSYVAEYMLQSAMLDVWEACNETLFNSEASVYQHGHWDVHMLESLLDYIDMILTLYRTIFDVTDFETQFKTNFKYKPLKVLQDFLKSLMRINDAELNFSTQIVALFVRHEDDLELQQHLQQLSSDECLYKYDEIIESIRHPELCALMSEMNTLLFEHFAEDWFYLMAMRDHVLENNILPEQMDILVYSSKVQNVKMPEVVKNAIYQFFKTAREQSEHLLNPEDVVYNPCDIQPIILIWQLTGITGLTSLFNWELQKEARLAFEKRIEFDKQPSVPEARLLCQQFVDAWKRGCAFQYLRDDAQKQRALKEHYKQISSARQWGSLGDKFKGPVAWLGKRQRENIHEKQQLLDNVKNACHALSVWQITMQKIQTEIDENVAAIGQRLKWAVGANHNLLTLQEAFNSCVQAQTQRYHYYGQLATQLIEYSNVLLHVEQLQLPLSPMEVNSGELSGDRTFVDTVTQWQEARNALRACGDRITPVEQSIVQLLDPEGKVDQCWIDNISGLLDEMTFAVQRQLADLERAAQRMQENIYESAQQLQHLIDNQLRLDLRHLLKSITKLHACSNNAEQPNMHISSRIREFQHAHKLFYAQLNDLQMKIISRDFAAPMLAELNEQITAIQQTLSDNYLDLVQLVQSFMQGDCCSGSPARVLRSGGSASNAESQQGSGAQPATEKKVINQREQKRNAYAVSVWKRIRMKLEGRDPDPNRRCTVTEQVDFIIREATHPDNLAVLYEGWTPWV